MMTKHEIDRHDDYEIFYAVRNHTSYTPVSDLPIPEIIAERERIRQAEREKRQQELATTLARFTRKFYDEE